METGPIYVNLNTPDPEIDVLRSKVETENKLKNSLALEPTNQKRISLSFLPALPEPVNTKAFRNYFITSHNTIVFNTSSFSQLTQTFIYRQ